MSDSSDSEIVVRIPTEFDLADTQGSVITISYLNYKLLGYEFFQLNADTSFINHHKKPCCVSYTV